MEKDDSSPNRTPTLRRVQYASKDESNPSKLIQNSVAESPSTLVNTEIKPDSFASDSARVGNEEKNVSLIDFGEDDQSNLPASGLSARPVSDQSVNVLDGNIEKNLSFAAVSLSPIKASSSPSTPQFPRAATQESEGRNVNNRSMSLSSGTPNVTNAEKSVPSQVERNDPLSMVKTPSNSELSSDEKTKGSMASNSGASSNPANQGDLFGGWKVEKKAIFSTFKKYRNQMDDLKKQVFSPTVTGVNSPSGSAIITPSTTPFLSNILGGIGNASNSSITAENNSLSSNNEAARGSINQASNSATPTPSNPGPAQTTNEPYLKIISQLQKKLEDLTIQNDKLKTTGATPEDVLKDFKTQLNSKNTEIKQLYELNEELQVQVQTLNSQIETMNKGNADLERKISNHRISFSDSENTISKLKAQFAELEVLRKGDLEKEQRALERCRELEFKLADQKEIQENECKRFEGIISELKAKEEKAIAEYKKYRVKVQQMLKESKDNSLPDSNSSAPEGDTVDSDTLSIKVTSSIRSSSKILELEQRCSRLSKENIDYREKLESLEQQIAALNLEVRNYTKKISQLEEASSPNGPGNPLTGSKWSDINHQERMMLQRENSRLADELKRIEESHKATLAALVEKHKEELDEERQKMEQVDMTNKQLNYKLKLLQERFDDESSSIVMTVNGETNQQPFPAMEAGGMPANEEVRHSRSGSFVFNHATGNNMGIRRTHGSSLRGSGSSIGLHTHSIETLSRKQSFESAPYQEANNSYAFEIQLEYLKSILLKFLSTKSESERSAMIPVLKTFLRLDPDEVKALMNAVQGTSSNGSVSTLLRMIPFNMNNQKNNNSSGDNLGNSSGTT